MINTHWLLTFCTLVEVGHFTRTAERLHMTQSGVSQHISKLEDYLGTAILEREGKQFTLSEAGKRLYQDARGILLSLDTLEQSLSDDPTFEGEVKILSPGSVGLKLYPHCLALQEKHPQLIFDFRFAPNTRVESAVGESEADIGFMTSRPSRADVSYEPISKEQLLLVTPSSIKKPDWETLLHLGFIGHPDGPHQADLLLGANFRQYQHCGQFPASGFSNQIGLILEPVSRGLGFTVLPAHAVEYFHAQHKIKAHKLAKPVYETIYACTHRYQPVKNRVQTVLSAANAWLADKPSRGSPR